MQAFQGMSVKGPSEQLRRLPDEIEQRLTGDWSRGRSRESTLTKSSLASDLYCFHCEESRNEESRNREAADLWLSRDSNQLRVSNIVPSEAPELSPTQYNDILREFVERFAKPAARSLGLGVEVSKPDITVKDLFPPDVVQALIDFSRQANRGSLASHPRDKARWQKFVIGAHQAQSEIGSDILSDWLVQQGWADKAARDLAIEYERGRSLLEQYKQQPQNA